MKLKDKIEQPKDQVIIAKFDLSNKNHKEKYNQIVEETKKKLENLYGNK